MAGSQQQPLSSSSYQQGNPIRFYDEECALGMDVEKAKGFLVLLDSDDLSFASITDGNIVDAFLGAPPLKKDNARYYAARDAKNRIATASDTSDSIQELSVLCYKQAIEVIIEHDKDVKNVFICCRCFVQGRMRKKSKKKLSDIFEKLQEAVSDST